MDGCKVRVDILHQNWLNNENLEFIGKVNYTTGELLEDHLKCKYKGQFISIKKGRDNIYCNMRGSLATFFNEGKHNFFDYSYQNLLDTLPILRKELDIIPKKTFFRNVEFAVMFESPVMSNILWGFMKFHKKGTFSNIVIDGKKVGIQIEHQRYTLKFYDKGLQFAGKHSNIVKFEIVITKMIAVKEIGLKTLEDLKNPNIWFELSKMLLDCWNEIIIVDDNLDYKAMSNYEQKKFLRFKDASFWNNLSSVYKPNLYLKKLIKKYQIKPNLKDIINNLIVEKCIKNVTEKNKEIGYQLTKYLKPIDLQNENQNILPINSYDKGLIDNLNHSHKAKVDERGKKTGVKYNKCKCRDCRKSLRNKKANTLFCSNACRQKYYYQKKKLASARERALLEKIKAQKIIQNTLFGLRFYNENKGEFEYKKYDEVMATNIIIGSLKEVLLIKNPNAKPQRLTHARARELMRYLSKKNINKNAYFPQ